MNTCVAIDPKLWEEVKQHLFQNRVEQSAMLYADVVHTQDDLRFNVAEVHCLKADDYDFQAAQYISLRDETRGRIIKRAWASKRAIVEVHSHVGPFAVAEFSSTDIDGFAEYVPHAMWRLNGAPYAAIVATETAFDGLVWMRRDFPSVQLHVVRVGDVTLEPTHATLQRRGTL